VENRYQLILKNSTLYREIGLPNDRKYLRLGTYSNCDIRLNKEYFKEDFAFTLENGNNGWIMKCDNNIYIASDDARSLVYRDLSHDDEFIVKYQKPDQVIFRVHFILDFACEREDYSRAVDVSSAAELKIGGSFECGILLKDELLGSDYITFTKRDGKYWLADNNTKYGFYINGVKAKNVAEIHNYDFFSIMGFSFYFKEERIYTSKSNKIEIHTSGFYDITNSKSHLEYPKFNRSTRIKSVVPDDKIEILDPPAKPGRPKNTIIVSLAPALIMLGLTIVLRGVMGNGSTFVIFSVCSMGMGIITSLYNIIHDRKEYRSESKNRIEKYTNYIANKRAEIDTLRKEELRILRDSYYSLEEEEALVNDFTGDLFNRSPLDADFLDVRIGTGFLLSNQQVDYKKSDRFETEDELIKMPGRLAIEYKFLRNAPVILKLTECNAIGIIGSSRQMKELMKNMLLDICIRQYHNDVKVFFVIDGKQAKQVEWIRLLPHIQNEALGIRNIVCDEESKNMIYEYLYKELSKREESKSVFPRIIVFVYSEEGLKSHPVSKYIETAGKYGFTFLFFEEYKELLPLGCQEMILLNKNEKSGKILNTSDSTRVINFSYESLEDVQAEKLVHKLAPVYCEEVNLEASLTKNITLYELLNIYTVEDMDLFSRWNSAEVYDSMAAPLGVKAKNQVVYLDLNEKYHGPHGLVAGTTGSGKSEILQTYILSMSTLFHPYEVSFVIIDFKGGGMVNQFKDLPHLIGAITNMDGREIERSLLSIKAELRKRQALFARSGINHIDAYIKLFKRGEVKTPLPHLILIVDEFAELKMNQPEFMKELISAARIGRSLGVHLILATQKPSGVIDTQIWSNSKFRLCLKVQNKEDSNEVLKTPLAAEIKEPGRAYLQVGNNEVFDLFQSAYSGAPGVMDDISAKKDYVISTVALSGKRTPVYVSKKGTPDKQIKTQLEVIVKYISDYCKINCIEHLPGICLPPLEERILYKKEQCKNSGPAAVIPLGIYDDPDNQRQDVAMLELSAGNTVIIGSAQYGKTCFMQVIIRGISDLYSPDKVSIYILDFGSMMLKVFENLNHVGGVVVASEDEKLKSTVKMLNMEIRERKERFSKIGITSYASFREAGHTDLPNILVFIDNFLALKELYPEYEEDILYLCREGTSVGISLIITSKQTNGISYKYLSNFSYKFCLYCNQADEYRNLFDKCRIQPLNIPGRGLLELNKNIYEFQAYLAFEGEKEIDRVTAIKKYIDKINIKYRGQKAKRIPEVPQVLDFKFVNDNLHSNKLKPYQLPIGIYYDTVEFTMLDLLKSQLYGITGREAEGKLNLIHIIFHYLFQGISENPVKAYIVDDYRRQLRDLSSYGFVERYTIDANEVEQLLGEFEAELQHRMDILRTAEAETLGSQPLLLLVIQNSFVLETNGLSRNGLETFKKILKVYRQLKVCFIFADVENVQIGYSAPELLKIIRDSKNLFFFDDLSNLKFTEVSGAHLKHYKKLIESDDAYLITEKGIQKLKCINGKESN
jgi:S-DNA-T family DNA segregation ATPase FtsK/SpoIIIE